MKVREKERWRPSVRVPATMSSGISMVPRRTAGQCRQGRARNQAQADRDRCPPTRHGAGLARRGGGPFCTPRSWWRTSPFVRGGARRANGWSRPVAAGRERGHLFRQVYLGRSKCDCHATQCRGFSRFRIFRERLGSNCWNARHPRGAADSRHLGVLTVQNARHSKSVTPEGTLSQRLRTKPRCGAV